MQSVIAPSRSLVQSDDIVSKDHSGFDSVI